MAERCDQSYHWLLRHMKGESMSAIARSVGVTRQCVHGCLRRLGVGPSARLWRHKSNAPHGAAKAYWNQKDRARQRGIEWQFDFDSWWAVWCLSGKWEQKGKRSHQYCMARTFDIGPYAPGNVRICTVAENAHEAALVRRAGSQALRAARAAT